MMLKHPTQDDWHAAWARGFRPNGTTGWFDRIAGVQMGFSRGPTELPRFADSFYPSNLHDYRYWYGGTIEDKWLADMEFFYNLFVMVENANLGWLRRRYARRMVTKHWLAVVEFGDSHFNFRPPLGDWGDAATRKA